MVSSRLVGRPRLRDLLDGALAEAGDGRGGCYALTGEAGIGKSRLLSEVERHATDLGMRVVRAAAWDDAGAPAFWLWTQVVRALAGARDPRRLRADWGPARTDLVLGLLPEHRSGAMESGTTADLLSADRFPLFDAVVSVVAAAGDPPLVLLLDDLHWADPGSLRLLQMLLAAPSASHVLVVAAWRDDEGAGASLDEIATRSVLLAVPALTTTEVGDLLASTPGLRVTQQDARLVEERTGGNPLFVLELGRLAATQGLSAIGALVPRSATAAIGRRVARLETPAADLLAAAAVAGPLVDPAELAEALHLDEADVQRRLDQTVAVRLLVNGPGRRLAFAHALVRDAVEEALPQTRRRELHLAVARAVEQRASPDRHARLAHHLTQAGPLAPPGLACHYWTLTAESADAAKAYELAADAFARAIATLPPDADGRSALWRRRGDCLLRSDDLATARTAFTEAASLARADGDPHELARAALGFAAGLSGFEVRLFDHAQIDLLEEALTALPTTDGEQRAYLLARLSVALSFVGTTERRAALAADAVAMARRLDAPAALAHALAAHCDAVAGPDEAEHRTDEAGEIIRIGEVLGDPALQLLGLRHRVVALLEQGLVDQAFRDVRSFEGLAARLRQPTFSWFVPLWRGLACHLAGDLEGLARYGEKAAAVGALADSANARILGQVQRMSAYIEAGEMGEHVDALLAQLAEVPELQPSAEPMLALFPGQPDEARRRALPQLGHLLEMLPVDSEYLANLLLCATSVIEGGDRGEPARLLHERTLPHAHRFAVDGIAAGFYGSVERFVGALGWLAGGPAAQDAETRLRRAVELNERCGALLAANHARRDLARLLLERDGPRDRADADALLDVAAQTYDRMRIPLRAHAARELRSTPTSSAALPDESGSVFRREGDSWRLHYRGRGATVRDGKGMRDLALLLARPGHEVHALDLMGRPKGFSAGHLGDVVDDRARAAYRRRITELDESIEEAEAMGDADGAERARAERAAILAELAGAFGLGGRARRTGDPAERARSTVTRRIRDAVARIETVHPELGAHLRTSVRTGTFCRYAPEVYPGWTL